MRFGVCKILNANLSRIQLPVKVAASLKVGINAYPLRQPVTELGLKLHPFVSGIQHIHVLCLQLAGSYIAPAITAFPPSLAVTAATRYKIAMYFVP